MEKFDKIYKKFNIKNFLLDEQDDVFALALNEIVNTKYITITQLQEKLKIGYFKAEKIIKQMIDYKFIRKSIINRGYKVNITVDDYNLLKESLA